MGVYTSRDLENWTLHPASPVMKPTAPHYLDRLVADRDQVDWRDPYLFFHAEDGQYHALICAHLPEWSDSDSGAAIGHMRSPDLIHWENLPPIATPGDCFYETEVPEYFELNGRHYLIFSTHSRWVRIDTATKHAACGTFYLMSDSFDGPYEKPDDCLLIGSGNYRTDQYEAYVGRTIPYEGGRLLYHHIGGPRPSWGIPKMLRQREDGTLYLEYMPLVEKLETALLLEDPSDIDLKKSQLYFGKWRREGDALVGSSGLGGTGIVLHDDAADFHLQVKISAASAEKAGVLFRHQFRKEAAAVLLDFERNELQVATGLPRRQYGTPLKVIDHFRCPLDRSRTYSLRLLMRSEFLEAYLDDRWALTTVLTEIPKSGKVSTYAFRGEADFSNIRLAAIESME